MIINEDRIRTLAENPSGYPDSELRTLARMIVGLTKACHQSGMRVRFHAGEVEQGFTIHAAYTTLNQREQAVLATCPCGWKVQFAPYSPNSLKMAEEAVADHHARVERQAQ